jgi:hypothetical protein
MSKETIRYQADLVANSIDLLGEALHELKQGKELSGLARDNLVLVLSQLEDARDIAFADDEAKKTEIMDKWL